MKKILFLIYLSAMLPLFTMAQSQITGQVLDRSTDIPLTGATIHAAKSNTSVTSDDQGNFRISISRMPDTLIISYVGYEKTTRTITVIPDGTMHIYLNAGIGQMREVVVSTGYQTLPKERMTGS